MMLNGAAEVVQKLGLERQKTEMAKY